MPKIRKYTARSLVPGFKMGKEFQGMTLVSVPKRKVIDGSALEVWVGESVMYITGKTKLLTDRVFQDKFGRGTYTMYYYEWKPEKQLELV